MAFSIDVYSRCFFICKLAVLLACGCTNSRFITAELQIPRTREHVFLAQCGARTECRPVRNKGVLDLHETGADWFPLASDVHVAAATVISAGPPSPSSLSCSALLPRSYVFSAVLKFPQSLPLYSSCG